MLTREERFYEVAVREVADRRPSPAIWGKAFSLSAGDGSKATALYFKLRVDQLEREYRETIPERLRQAWSAITNRQPFACPYCEADDKAKREAVDGFVQLFTGAPPHRYYCRACGVELRADAPVPVRPAPKPSVAFELGRFARGCGFGGDGPTKPPTKPPAAAKSNNGAAVTGFVLGVASIGLYAVGIIPVLA